MKVAPTIIPENGFYYHYKHNPEGSINNYAYNVIGTGFHTEKEDPTDGDYHMVIYEPLYESSGFYKNGKLFGIRPLNLFLGTVEMNGKIVPRFTKITDEEIISKLKKIREELYA